MKNKDEIKKDIYNLAQKISRASSEKFLSETTREMYEMSILLKHASDEETKDIDKEEKAAPKEEPAKTETQPIVAEKRQTSVDLFSIEAEPAPVKAETPPPAPAPASKKETPKESKKSDESVAEKLQHKKIADLKASIGINEKFQFINELFDGNMKEYNVALDQINSFSSHSEAESYIANLEDVYKWKSDNHIAENFRELVQRRFA